MKPLLTLLLLSGIAPQALADANCAHSQSWQCTHHASSTGTTDHAAVIPEHQTLDPHTGTTNEHTGSILPDHHNVVLAPTLLPSNKPQKATHIPSPQPMLVPHQVPTKTPHPQTVNAPYLVPPLAGTSSSTQAQVIPQKVAQVPNPQPMLVPHQVPTKTPHPQTVSAPNLVPPLAGTSSSTQAQVIPQKAAQVPTPQPMLAPHQVPTKTPHPQTASAPNLVPPLAGSSSSTQMTGLNYSSHPRPVLQITGNSQRLPPNSGQQHNGHILVTHQPLPTVPGMSTGAAQGQYGLEMIEPGIENHRVEVYRSGDAHEKIYSDNIPVDAGGFNLTVIGTRNPHYMH